MRTVADVMVPEYPAPMSCHWWSPVVETATPPKGHSAPTLELVRHAVNAAPGDVSAAEVAETIGVSRATAQRYLTYLTKHGIVRLQLRYGATGRPEHRYTLSV